MNVMINEETGCLEELHKFRCSTCGVVVWCMESDLKSLKGLSCPQCDRLCWEEVNVSEAEEETDVVV